MKKIQLNYEFTEFIGLGFAWQHNKLALCIPFTLITISWKK